MSFKEKAIRGHTTKSGNVGTAVSTGVQLATVIGGAIAGGMGALGGSGGASGAVMGAMRVSGIASPGAQIAMSSIAQAKQAKTASTDINNMLTGGFEKDFFEADKSLRMLNKMPADFIMEALLQPDKDGNITSENYNEATETVALLEENKKLLQREMLGSYMKRQLAQDEEEKGK